jgi:hypothetical protein
MVLSPLPSITTISPTRLSTAFCSSVDTKKRPITIIKLTVPHKPKI